MNKRAPSVASSGENGHTIRTTAEHPFYVKGKGWTPASSIKKGDMIRTEEGWIEVTSSYDSGEYETVYNVRVSEFHTYFVGDQSWGFSVWAHNRYELDETQEETVFGRAAIKYDGLPVDPTHDNYTLRQQLERVPAYGPGCSGTMIKRNQERVLGILVDGGREYYLRSGGNLDAETYFNRRKFPQADPSQQSWFGGFARLVSKAFKALAIVGTFGLCSIGQTHMEANVGMLLRSRRAAGTLADGEAVLLLNRKPCEEFCEPSLLATVGGFLPPGKSIVTVYWDNNVHGGQLVARRFPSGEIITDHNEVQRILQEARKQPH
jgi:hypothetical protein